MVTEVVVLFRGRAGGGLGKKNVQFFNFHFFFGLVN